MTSNENTRRERVYQFYKSNSDKPKSFTVNHFMSENIPKSTIYDIIKRVEDKIPPERRKGSGRKPLIMTDNLIRNFEHKCGISQLKYAKKLKCSHQYISKTLKTKTSIRKRKKIKIPKRTDAQRARIRRLCGHLYKNYKDFIWILDDESYFTLSNSEINGNDIFYSSNVELTPSNVKYKTKQKFEDKLLVYVVMSPFGVSTPYIAPSKTAINQDIYINKCLSKKLIPMIEDLPKNSKYIFWPDLASSHYSKKTIDF